MKLTINSALALSDTVKARISELKMLRSEVSVQKTTRNTYENRVDETVETPQFDVKKVDIKITELENFMFSLTSAIKTVNAKTEIGIEVDVDKLLAPIE
jgi:hypothetical protein